MAHVCPTVTQPWVISPPSWPTLACAWTHSWSIHGPRLLHCAIHLSHTCPLHTDWLPPPSTTRGTCLAGGGGLVATFRAPSWGQVCRPWPTYAPVHGPRPLL